MYYAEKIVNGILYCRHSPNARWQKASVDMVNHRLVETMKHLEKAIEEGTMKYDRGYGDGRQSVTNELTEQLVCQLHRLIG